MFLFLAYAVFLLGGGTAQASTDPLEVCRGDHLVVSAQLLQNGSFGSPVLGQEVEFYDETADVLIDTAMTGEDGTASVDWIVPQNHQLGHAVINATFRGNISLALAPSCQWFLVDIYSATDLDVSVNDITLSPLDVFLCSVSVMNDMDDPITDSMIQIYGNGVLVDSGNTNSTGYFDFVIECSPQWCVYGENVMEVVYATDSVEYNFKANEVFTILVQRVTTQIVPLKIVNDISLNETVEIVLALDSQEGFLPDAVLNLLLDDKNIEVFSTNSSGLTTLQLQTDEQFSIGQHQLTVMYEGSFRYQETSLTLDITVTSPCVVELVLPDEFVLETQVIIELEVYDVFHRPIVIGSATLSDNSTGITIEETGSGFQPFSFLFSVEGERGLREIILNITGNPYISNRTLVLRVTVWAIPEILVTRSSIDEYAYPSQEIEIEFKLLDDSYPIAHSDVMIVIGENRENYVTDANGMVIATWIVSSEEGKYIARIMYSGVKQEFLAPTSYTYDYSVSREIPLRVEMIDYEVLEALQELLVRLTVTARNGSSFGGIGVSFSWLGSQFNTISQLDGGIELHLSVPIELGTYNLSYQTQDVASLISSSGYFPIIIRGYQAHNSQGVGIGVMVISSVLAVIVSVIPIIRRRQLMG